LLLQPSDAPSLGAALTEKTHRSCHREFGLPAQPRLSNPKNDATDIAAEPKKLSFLSIRQCHYFRWATKRGGKGVSFEW